MVKIIHPIAGTIALLTIATFWVSTACSELFASQTTTTAVKTAISWGFPDSGAGGSGRLGYRLGEGSRARLINAKIKRMPLIAANRILVLIPCALYALRQEPPSSIRAFTQCKRSNSLRVQRTSLYSRSTCAMASR